jgi:5'-nucleotidase
MRVLVTNDDGIDSPGLAALAEMVGEAGHTPVVAAPVRDQSGVAAALGPLDDPSRVSIERVSMDGLDAHAVHAPTALIVMLAMQGGFGEAPDLVVSGINNGPNTGRSTLHSATVAAVLVAGYHGRSGLAVSQVDGAPQLWSTAATMARPLLDWLCHAPVATLLNLNVPNSDPGDVLGLRQAGLASVGGVKTVVLGRDETGIDIDLVPTRRELPPGLDSTLLREGWATVSAIAPPTSLDIELPTEQWWSDR